MRVKTMSQAILLLGLIVAPCLAIAAEPTKEGWFTTNDGVKLHYFGGRLGQSLGDGSGLVAVGDGVQVSADWLERQIPRPMPSDMRLAMESPQSRTMGYRIQRLSAGRPRLPCGRTI